MSEAAAGGGAPATGGDSAQLGGSIAVTPEAAPAPATGGEPSPPSSPNLGSDSGLIGSQPMQQETDSAAPIEQNNGLIGDQTNNTDWLNDVPEEYRTDPFFNKYNSKEEMYKGVLNLNKTVGKKALEPPNEHSTPEEIRAWNDKIGVPEDARKYDLPESLKDADGNDYFEFNHDSMTGTFDKFHELGLTNKQSIGVMEHLQGEIMRSEADNNQSQEQAAIENRQKTISTLKKEWGNQYEINMQIANHVANNLGITDHITNLGLESNVETYQMLNKIASRFAESSITGTLNPTQGSTFDDQVKEISKDRTLTRKERGAKKAALYEKRNKSIGRQ